MLMVDNKGTSEATLGLPVGQFCEFTVLTPVPP